VHGLTTAAAIWECAAIGMAAAAGLVKLAILVTFLHFVIVLGFTPLTNRLTARLAGSARLHITYEPNHGVLGRILQVCQQHRWALSELSSDPDGGVLLTITGSGIRRAPSTVAGVDGVTSLRHLADKDDSADLAAARPVGRHDAHGGERGEHPEHPARHSRPPTPAG
jgi:putative Mg2+ transporter-C (MgtC) family protein